MYIFSGCNKIAGMVFKQVFNAQKLQRTYTKNDWCYTHKEYSLEQPFAKMRILKSIVAKGYYTVASIHTDVFWSELLLLTYL